MSQVAAIQSAQTVAALRAAVTNETSLAVACQDGLAKHFISLRERIMTTILPQPLIRWALERAAPGSYGFAIARTRCFDDALLSEAADGIQQVVIVGAGYDSRAIRFADELKGVRVFEVDHPGTQARKMSILLRSNIEVPKNVQYVPVDFNRDTLEAELAKKGFSRSRRTLFLWEGVSYYLQKPVVTGVLRFAAGCAPGSSIILDYALRKFVEGDTSTYGGEVVANWLRKIGEPFVFGLNPHETPHFLGECGLKPVYDLSPEDTEARYLARKGGGILRRTLGHVRIVHARNVK
jgi:methyltransferase (TIGR00027 family)